MKSSAESTEKNNLPPLETWRAVKGARRAFILILDGPLRPHRIDRGTKRNEVQ